MTEKSTSQQLDEALKAVESATARVEELKALTRAEDLKTVLNLIGRHGFTQTDLKSVLKTRAVKSSSGDTQKRAYNKRKKS